MTASEVLSLRYYEICCALLHRWNFASKNDKDDMNDASRRSGASYEELRSILKYLRAQYLNNYMTACQSGDFSGDLFAFYAATKKRPGGNRRSNNSSSMCASNTSSKKLHHNNTPRRPSNNNNHAMISGAGELMGEGPAAGGNYGSKGTQNRRRRAASLRLMDLVHQEARSLDSYMEEDEEEEDEGPYYVYDDVYDVRGLAEVEESRLPLKKRSKRHHRAGGKVFSVGNGAAAGYTSDRRMGASDLKSLSDDDIPADYDDDDAAAILFGLSHKSRSFSVSSVAAAPAAAPSLRPSTSEPILFHPMHGPNAITAAASRLLSMDRSMQTIEANMAGRKNMLPTAVIAQKQVSFPYPLAQVPPSSSSSSTTSITSLSPPSFATVSNSSSFSSQTTVVNQQPYIPESSSSVDPSLSQPSHYTSSAASSWASFPPLSSLSSIASEALFESKWVGCPMSAATSKKPTLL